MNLTRIPANVGSFLKIIQRARRPPDRLSHILNTFDELCNLGVSGILRCCLRGVLGEVDPPDESDVDHLGRCEHVEGERVLRVDSDVEWDYGAPRVALLQRRGR